MSSPLLTLFTRSLREDALSKATYWARAGLGGFILLVLLAISAAGVWTGAPGRSFFITIITLQMVAITFVGLSYFASAVTEEKEEQTLGLLRMTDLNPLSILLGKSTSRLGGALLLLAAQFPFTVFAVTLGGISLGQIFAAYCTLAAYTFLLCNVALLGSVLARRTPGAASFSVLLIGLLLSAGPLLGVLHRELLKYGAPAGLDQFAGMLWKTTPIARLIEVLGTGFAGSPAGWQVASNLALGAGSFLLAWVLFERCCDRTTDEAVATEPVPRPAVGGRLGRPPRPRKDALIWKDFHFLCGGRMGLIVRSLGYGGALAGAIGEVIFHGSSGGGGMTAMFHFLVPFVFSIDVAAMAARLFRSEIDGQTLSALAVLPGTMRQIVRRKAGAFLLAAAPGAICTVAGGLLQLIFFTGSSGTREIGLMMFMHMVSGWVGVILLVHVVAWLSLSMKRGALPIGYVTTYALRTLISLLAMLPMAGLNFSFGRSAASFNFALLSPLLSCAVSIVVTFILHQMTLRRLEALAGEG